MQHKPIDRITQHLSAAKNQQDCADAVAFLTRQQIPGDTAIWLSDLVETFVRDDHLAVDLHARLEMASNGPAA